MEHKNLPFSYGDINDLLLVVNNSGILGHSVYTFYSCVKWQITKLGI